MANSSNTSLLNPFTPMAFLPPDQAYERAISEYVFVGGLSVLIWDILTHLHADYKLLARHRINLPTAIYFLSRWSTLSYAVTTAVFLTAPVDNCVVLVKLKCAVYHISASSTSLLFFLRVRAIFNRNRHITIGFFALWLTVLGGSMTAAVSISGVHLGNTKYCAFSNIKSYLTAIGNITLATFDTCVFVAITWRLSHSYLSIKNDDAVVKKDFDLLGKYLPAFSRALLHDGQKYYMVAMIANLLVLIMEFVPGVPLSYRALFLAPAMELTNIMACRVFRHTKRGLNNEEVSAVSAIVFRKNNNTPVFNHAQKGDLTRGSVSWSEIRSSSVTETEAPSKSSHSSNELESISKEESTVISVV